LFTPVKNKGAIEEIFSQINHLVPKTILKPGDKQPSETELGRPATGGPRQFGRQCT